MKKMLIRAKLVFFRDLVGKALIEPASKSRWIAGLYYILFNTRFLREQQSFIAGRLEYEKSLGKPDGSLSLLRRNTHRLEKGLLMRPRRTPFALDYIEETLDAYLAAISANDHDPQEIKWANDVLTQYFEVNQECHDLEELGRKFRRSKIQLCDDEVSFVPYFRDLTIPPSISYDDLLELATRRRSVRWFLPKSVPRELIDKALEVGALAPSACNRQPFEFRIIDEPSLLKQIVEVPFGLSGYGHNVPCLIVIIGQQSYYFDERDRHLIYIDGSLAAMGFLFALETLGLSSCCVNWPDVESNERRLAKLLNLRIDQRPVMLMAVGYPDPDGMVAKSPKKSMNRIRRYNFE